MRIQKAVAIAIVLLAGCRHQAPEVEQPRARPVAPLFDPADAHSKLEGPERDKWQKPKEIVKALGLKHGDKVADIGAGSGYLLPYLSHTVGEGGQVYAEEIQEAYLPDLRRHAGNLRNVEVILGTAEDPKLRQTMDEFVLLTVYHEVQQPVEFLKALRKYAKPAARLAIIDFDAKRKGEFPAPDGHEVAETDVIAEAKAAGWKLQTKYEFLGSQFFLIFKLETPAPQ